METAGQPLPKLGDLLKPETTREQFEQIAEQLITERDKELFGDHAKDRMLTGILYLASFAPEPATFDLAAYKAVVGFDETGQPLKDEETSRLLQIAKETGVFKEAEGGRLMVDNKVHPILEQLLHQYE